MNVASTGQQWGKKGKKWASFGQKHREKALLRTKSRRKEPFHLDVQQNDCIFAATKP